MEVDAPVVLKLDVLLWPCLEFHRFTFLVEVDAPVVLKLDGAIVTRCMSSCHQDTYYYNYGSRRVATFIDISWC